MLLLFVYVFGGAIHTGGGRYVDYLLPGILLITVASGISYTAYRLFTDVSGGIFERFQSMPIARSSRAVGSRADLARREPGLARARRPRRPGDGVPHRRRTCCLAGRRRHPGAVHAGADLAGGHPGLTAKSVDGVSGVLLPADLPAVRQLGVRAHRTACPARCAGSPSTSRSPRSSTRSAHLFAEQPVGSDGWIALAWCVGLLLVAYALAMLTYRRKFG